MLYSDYQDNLRYTLFGFYLEFNDGSSYIFKSIITFQMSSMRSNFHPINFFCSKATGHSSVFYVFI